MSPESTAKRQTADHARPQKRAKPSGPTFERGSDLSPEKCVKCLLKLPQRFTPGALQSNRVGLLVSLTYIHGSEVNETSYLIQLRVWASFCQVACHSWRRRLLGARWQVHPVLYSGPHEAMSQPTGSTAERATRCLSEWALVCPCACACACPCLALNHRILRSPRPPSRSTATSLLPTCPMRSIRMRCACV